MLETAKKFLNRRILGKENLNKHFRVGVTHEVKNRKDGGIQINIDYRGKNVGFAVLYYKYMDAGKPVYELHTLKIKEEDRGKDYGSNLIDIVNSFLDEKDYKAYLTNHIDRLNFDFTRSLRGLHGRHGWKYYNKKDCLMGYKL